MSLSGHALAVRLVHLWCYRLWILIRFILSTMFQKIMILTANVRENSISYVYGKGKLANTGLISSKINSNRMEKKSIYKKCLNVHQYGHNILVRVILASERKKKNVLCGYINYCLFLFLGFMYFVQLSDCNGNKYAKS